MVSVVFLMLLFYLAAGSLIKDSELAVDLPETADLPLEKLPRPLLLVTETALVLDGRVIERTHLAEEAGRSARVSSEPRPVTVLADRNMAAGPFLAVVTELRAAGLPVRILTVRRKTAEGEGRS